MSASTLGPFRPQHSKRPGCEADNVPVVIGKHREIPLQQTLKAHMRARPVGPPRTPIITLAKPRKEGTDRQRRLQPQRRQSREHRLISMRPDIWPENGQTKKSTSPIPLRFEGRYPAFRRPKWFPLSAWGVPQPGGFPATNPGTPDLMSTFRPAPYSPEL
jgi:hypothetical protein